MSYILDALKKSEQERDLGRVPGLQTVHRPAATGHSRRWPWLLGTLLIANSAILYLLYRPAPIATPVGLQVAANEDEEPAARSMPAPPPQDLGALPLDPRPEIADQTPAALTAPGSNEERTAPQAAAPRTVRSLVGEPHLGPRDREPPLAEQPDATPDGPGGGAPLRLPPLPQESDAALDFPAEPESVVRAPRSIMAPPATPAALQPTPEPAPEPTAPLLEQMPAAFRSTLPTLAINVHAYDRNPAARLVLINMKRYREGDRVEGGLVVEAITPGGVILSKNGERFRLARQ